MYPECSRYETEAPPHNSECGQESESDHAEHTLQVSRYHPMLKVIRHHPILQVIGHHPSIPHSKDPSVCHTHQLLNVSLPVIQVIHQHHSVTVQNVAGQRVIGGSVSGGILPVSLLQKWWKAIVHCRCSNSNSSSPPSPPSSCHPPSPPPSSSVDPMCG